MAPVLAADALQVVPQSGDAVDDLHRAAPEHVARADQQREADLRRALERLLARSRGRVRGRVVAEPVEQRPEPRAVLGEVDRVDARAQNRDAGGVQAGGELERRLAAELDHHPFGLLHLAHRQHVLERQRLEVQPVRGVVVGRDGLGVAVDHDRVAALLAHRLGGVHAAVVELDSLPDPVRPRAEDHDARPRRRAGPRGWARSRPFPAGVVVRRLGGELRRAGVDRLERPLAGERRLRIGDQLGRARAGTTDRCASGGAARRSTRRAAAPRAGGRSARRPALATSVQQLLGRRRARSAACRARASAAPWRTPA